MKVGSIAWHKAQRDEATEADALDFCRTLARLATEGKKGTFANLGGGPKLEQARQIARKKGWCYWPGKGGQGWLLTDDGRAAITKAG